MHYPVVVRAESEHRYVARPVGLPEIEAEAETEQAAIDAVRQKLKTWLGDAKLVQVEVTPTSGNLWLDFFGSSADDPDWEDYQAEIKRVREQANAE
jgi:predicted RNase H-like HicB family nuclease